MAGAGRCGRRSLGGRPISGDRNERDLQSTAKSLGGLLQAMGLRPLRRVEDAADLAFIHVQLVGQGNARNAATTKGIIDSSLRDHLGRWRDHTGCRHVLGGRWDFLTVTDAPAQCLAQAIDGFV